MKAGLLCCTLTISTKRMEYKKIVLAPDSQIGNSEVQHSVRETGDHDHNLQHIILHAHIHKVRTLTFSFQLLL